MQEVREWIRVLGYGMLAVLIIMVITVVALLFMYPIYFTEAVNLGINIGEKL